MAKKKVKGTLVIKSFPSKEVDFFLRIHRHLPDEVCGGYVFNGCKYRKDGIPLNSANEPIEELRKDKDFLREEGRLRRVIKMAKRGQVKSAVKEER